MTSARLLIVEDDPEMRSFLTSELAVEGYECEEAACGQQALGRIRTQTWDLVLLDWNLPDFSGVEVCRRMRKGRHLHPHPHAHSSRRSAAAGGGP